MFEDLSLEMKLEHRQGPYVIKLFYGCNLLIVVNQLGCVSMAI